MSPPSEERLAWLTGFTGSAGAAIVLTRERAPIFVDGRYTLQAAKQVDTQAPGTSSRWSRPPPEHVAGQATSRPASASALTRGCTLPTAAERLAAACATAGADRWVAGRERTRSIPGGPRPPGPAARRPVTIHAAAIRRREVEAEKLTRDPARDRQARRRRAGRLSDPPCGGLDLQHPRRGRRAHAAAARPTRCVPKDGRPPLFIDHRKLSNPTRDHLEQSPTCASPSAFVHGSRELGAQQAPRSRLDSATAADALSRLIAGAGGKPRARQRSGQPAEGGEELRRDRGHADRAPARRRRRWRASSAWIDREAPTGTLTEIDAVEALETFRRETGALKDVSFPTIAGTGPNGAIVHYRVTRKSNRRIAPGDLLLIDSGAQYEDGTTDVTRTIAIGKPTDEMRDRFTRVLRGPHRDRARGVPDGTTGAQLDCFRAAIPVAGRPRFRARHRPWRRQLSLGA